MFYSQRGNKSFPTWEQIIPKVGIIEINIVRSYLFRRFLPFWIIMPL